jgi:hypothetical protein
MLHAYAMTLHQSAYIEDKYHAFCTKEMPLVGAIPGNVHLEVENPRNPPFLTSLRGLSSQNTTLEETFEWQRTDETFQFIYGLGCHIFWVADTYT